jgi:hypothetical protein
VQECNSLEKLCNFFYYWAPCFQNMLGTIVCIYIIPKSINPINKWCYLVVVPKSNFFKFKINKILGVQKHKHTPSWRINRTMIFALHPLLVS